MQLTSEIGHSEAEQVIRLRHKHMAKRPKAAPIVDDADVQRIADIFLNGPADSTVSDETIAKAAYEVGYAHAQGTTPDFRRKFAQKVRQRVEFARMARRRTP